MSTPDRSDHASPITVTPDTPRRILRLRFRARVRQEHARAAADRVRELVPAVAPGFVRATDQTGLEDMDLDCVPHLTRIMDLSRAAGIAKVIRVIPDPDNGFGVNLLSLVHARGRVPALTFTTSAAAEPGLPRA